MDVASVRFGQTCSVSLKCGKSDQEWLKKVNIRKGMVLIESKAKAPKATYEFKAEFKLTGQEQSDIVLPPFYEPTVTSSTFRQTCVLINDDPTEYATLSKKSRPQMTTSTQGKIISQVTCDESDDILANSGKKKKRTYSEYPCTPDDHKNVAKLLSIPEPLSLNKTRSKSNDFSSSLSESFTTEENTSRYKKKRIKHGRNCHLDKLLAERGIMASKVTPQELVLKPKVITTIRFRFKYQPEYMPNGAKILINDDKLKVTGTVVETFTF